MPEKDEFKTAKNKTTPSNLHNIEKRPGPGDHKLEAAFVRIWADKDDRSLIRLAPEVVQQKMLELPKELREMSEQEMIRSWQGKITVTWKQIRLNFWMEYDRVQREYQNRMESRAIVRGICAEDTWYRLLKHPEFVAFIITPPSHYTIRLQEAVNYGYERLREILDLPVTDKDGKSIPRNADLILKTTLALDMRFNGAVAQKLQIENKSINFSMKGSVADAEGAAEHMTMEKLEKQILKLKREQEQAMLRGAMPLPGDFANLSHQEKFVDAEVISSETQDASLVETGDHGGTKF